MEQKRTQQGEVGPGPAPAFDFRRLRAVYGNTVPSPPKAPKPRKGKAVERRRILKPGDNQNARTSISQELANVKDFRQLLRTGPRRTPRVSHAGSSESSRRLRAETDRLADAARQLKSLLSTTAPRFHEEENTDRAAQNDEVDFTVVAESSQLVEDMLLAPRTPSPDELPVNTKANAVEVSDASSHRSPVENPLLPLQYQSSGISPGTHDAAAVAGECSDVEWSSDSDEELPPMQKSELQQPVHDCRFENPSTGYGYTEKKRVVQQSSDHSPEVGDAYVDMSTSIHEEELKLQASTSSSIRLRGHEAGKRAAAFRMLENATDENVHFVRQKLLMKKRMLEIGIAAVLTLMVIVLALGVS